MALKEIQRSVTKLGISLPKHSQITDPKEFWPWVVDGSTIPNWPSNQYPLLLYTSSDHSVSTGGVYLRVYDTSAGTFPSASGWVEWQDVSSRSEFSHITQKTNPIYYDDVVGHQTETPTVHCIDGVVYMTYHNSNMDMGYVSNVQNTSLATGTNGVDFERHGVIVTYDPNKFAGSGHTGYLRWGINTIEEIPYKYIGVCSHGGGSPSRGGLQQIVVSNDIYSWETYTQWGRAKGRLSSYNPANPPSGVDWIWQIEEVHQAKRDGNYYRVMGRVRDQIGVGGAISYVRPTEILIDHEFNIVAEPNVILDLGGSGSIDETEVSHYQEFEFEGSTYAVYRALDAVDSSSIAFCSASEAQGAWNDKMFFSNKQEIVNITPEGNRLDLSDYSQITGTSVSGQGIDGFQHRIQMLNDGSHSDIVSAVQFNMSNYDILDFDIKGLAPLEVSDVFALIGLVNSDYYTSAGTRLLLRYEPTFPNLPEDLDAARSIPLEFVVKPTAAAATTRKTDNTVYIGKSPNWYNNSLDESIFARKNIGIRIIKSLNKAFIKCGVSEMEWVDITGFDYSEPLILTLRFRSADDVTANSMAFLSTTVKGYTNTEDTSNLSTLNSTVTGIPDGSYKLKLYKESDPLKTKPVFDGVVTYTSGGATIDNVRVSVGESVQGRIVDNENPHVNGAVITGVTA